MAHKRAGVSPQTNKRGRGPQCRVSKMTSIFLSHSSRDKPLARRIASDLRDSGISVWLDEWEILVGDSITQKIQQGLDQTEFVAVLLTLHSVQSGWVDKEWQSRIGDEAQNRDVVVLPLRADACDIPRLLRDKRYADFAESYESALGLLIDSIKGHLARRKEVTHGDAEQDTTTEFEKSALAQIVPSLESPLQGILRQYSNERNLRRVSDLLVFLSQDANVLSHASPERIATDDFEEFLEDTINLVSREKHHAKRIAYGEFLSHVMCNPDVNYNDTRRRLHDLEQLDPDHLRLMQSFLIEPPYSIYINEPRSSSLAVLIRRFPDMSPESLKEKIDDLHDLRLIKNSSGRFVGETNLREAEALCAEFTPNGSQLLRFLGFGPTKERTYSPTLEEGTDEYGRFVDINYKGVVQRMRWIPPGRFVSGSPENEEGRPEELRCESQCEIGIQRGFWLADTPCTQELWEVVMPDDVNPSWEFHRGPKLPVSDVGLHPHIRAFIERLNCDANVRLPSSEEWEYACRAGTSTRFWFGDDISTNDVNYSPEKWWGKGTVDVKSLPCNSWGLYQMHGNVWEICCSDIRSWAGCTIHGGCWDSPLSDVRSAACYAINTNSRSKLGQYGFRFAIDDPLERKNRGGT